MQIINPQRLCHLAIDFVTCKPKGVYQSAEKIPVLMIKIRWEGAGGREGGRGEQTPPILKITTYKSLHSIDSPALHWNIFYSIWSTDNSIVVHHTMYHTIHSFVRCNCTALHRSGRDCTDDGKLLREILPGGLTATEHRDWETELEKRQKRTMGPKDRFQHPWRLSVVD